VSAAGSASTSWQRMAAASLVVGLATFVVLMAASVALAPRAAAAADDSSAVTVTAQQQDPDAADAPFPNLSVTVAQTKDLVNQGVRLTYSGGRRSTYKNDNVEGADFLQIMQCWGDLKDAQGNLIKDEHGQPQPDRTTCQYGSLDVGQGQTRNHVYPWDGNAVPAAITADDQPFVHKGSGPFDAPEVAIPFKSVTGKQVARIVGGNIDPTVELVSNEFYGPYTTNEVPWAGFGEDGTGTVTFEMQTAMQAPGLGCGSQVKATDGTVKGQACWLVVVPRGDHDVDAVTTTESALLAPYWKHRLAIRLDFQPVGARCALGAAEQQVSGSELVATAIHSWQPVVCNQAGGSIYNIVITGESDAAARANGTGVAPLALVSRPFDAAVYGTTDDLTYAPIAVTGLTVVFAVDHFASADPSDPAPDDVKALEQLPFTQMNLTPRLIAKLLTNSYRGSLPNTATVSDVLAHNPWNITQDPDFLAINPAWRHQALQNVAALADVFVPLGTSDSAWAVWNYVVADKSARDFLAGKPDPWGMKVDPWATTDADYNATVNPPGVANEYPLDRFPKPDPSTGYLNAAYTASLVDAIAWRPYSTTFDQAAYWVLRGDNRVTGWTTGQSSGGVPGFTTEARKSPGAQQVMGLTDTASAATYEVYTAALLNPAGSFVTPTTASMSAAAAAMTNDATQPQVVAFDPASDKAKAANDAYPLTVPVYAAMNPAGGDDASRAAAVALIRYAAGTGQTPGTSLGQLPPGYAPIPDAWRAQAQSAADKIAATSQAEAASTDESTTATDPGSEPDATTDLDSTDFTDLVPSDQLPSSPVPSAPAAAAAGAPSPTPRPSATGPAGPVVGAAMPDDSSAGPLGAAVPISAGAGVLAAAAVPFVARPRRRP
jgi:hypothetical protein